MTTAEKVIKPTKAGIFRAVFIYTGQGETTLLVIPTGPNVADYMYVMVDSDLDKDPNEVNLVTMFKDLFKSSGKLSVFVNTHPHNDHIGGIREIYDEIGFDEVWHSNHKPGGDHKKKFEDLQYVIKKVGAANEYHLKGTNDNNKIRKVNGDEIVKTLGNITYVVLSPAEYLCDEIEEGGADERNARIHEQCGVIKFTYGKTPKSILFTGDADKKAFQDHITDYHQDKLSADVLSCSHHGSRTFFKNDEDDEDVYEKHIEEIDPTYLIISAPKQEDSPHGHPHDDAMELYEKHVEVDGIFHLGSKPYSVIVDIDQDGNLSLETDTELIETYSDKDDEDDNDDDNKRAAFIIPSTTRIDRKPMGEK